MRDESSKAQATTGATGQPGTESDSAPAIEPNSGLDPLTSDTIDELTDVFEGTEFAPFTQAQALGGTGLIAGIVAPGAGRRVTCIPPAGFGRSTVLVPSARRPSRPAAHGCASAWRRPRLAARV